MVNEKEIKLFKEKKECCGCTACLAICSRTAISMMVDREGFEYPYINEEKCIRCYKCFKVCPMKIDIAAARFYNR